MQDCRTFADAFNYLLYGGRMVIDPQALHPLDTTITGVPYGADGTDTPVQRFRDELKGLTLMEDGMAVYLLLGIENQSDVNYAMPVKDMVYDALQYAAQVEKIARSHREAMRDSSSGGKISGGEYLTGFYRDDRLIPVITLVVFFSAEVWDGPRSIHDMLSVTDPDILSFIPDYRINLIAPCEMSDEEIDRFTTNLREVFLFIKYSKDKDQLRALVSKDDRFRSVERNAVRVINTVTRSQLTFSDDEEALDVCKAIDDMRTEARTEGRIEGRTADILELLSYLPGKLPENLRISISSEKDNGILTKYLRFAATSSSVKEFVARIS